MATLQKLFMLFKTLELRVQFQPNWVSNCYRAACPGQIALSVQVTPKYAPGISGVKEVGISAAQMPQFASTQSGTFLNFFPICLVVMLRIIQRQRWNAIAKESDEDSTKR